MYRLSRSLAALLLLALALVLPAAADNNRRSTSASGKLVSLSPAARTLTIRTADGRQVILQATEKTRILRNGAPVRLTGLALGDDVTAQFDPKTLRVLSLNARGPAVTTTRGSLLSVDLALQRLRVTTPAGAQEFQLTPTTLFVRNGRAAAAGDLATGDALVIHSVTGPGDASVATDVVATGPEEEEVKGTITAIAGSNVTITPKRGGAVTVKVDDLTMIRIKRQGNRVQGTLADLQVGMKAEAEFDPVSFVAFKIEAKQQEAEEARVEGKVMAVDAAAGSITIDPERGNPVTLGVNGSTKIKLNGDPARLADIPVGAEAEAKFDPRTNIASKIEAETDDDEVEAEVEGKVMAVSASSITIDPERGSPVTLAINPSTVIIVDGKPGTAADIHVGDEAEAKFDRATMTAIRIKVETEDEVEEAEVEGKVMAVSATSITIDPEQGSPVTLAINSSTVIIVDDKPGTAADIHVGDEAEAKFDRATMTAIRIKVEDEDDD